MNVIIVDDENWAIEDLKNALEKRRVDVVGTFTDSTSALDYVISNLGGGNDIDVAFLDIEMPEMNGIELGEKLRSLNKSMGIIYLTAYDDRFKEAYTRVMPDAYLLKPLNDQALDMVLKQNDKSGSQNRAIIETFGKFEVIDRRGRVVDFPLKKKSTELLAVCVDGAGEFVDRDVIIERVWPDNDPDSPAAQANYRSVVTQVKKILREHDIADILVTRRGACKVDANLIDCEYIEIIKGRLDIAESTYNNNYIPGYAWAAERNMELLRKKIQ